MRGPFACCDCELRARQVLFRCRSLPARGRLNSPLRLFQRAAEPLEEMHCDRRSLRIRFPDRSALPGFPDSQSLDYVSKVPGSDYQYRAKQNYLGSLQNSCATSGCPGVTNSFERSLPFSAAVSCLLSLNPLSNVGWTVLELDAVRFAIGQELHRFSIYKCDVRQIKGQIVIG